MSGTAPSSEGLLDRRWNEPSWAHVAASVSKSWGLVSRMPEARPCCACRFPVVLCPLAGENGGGGGSQDGGAAAQAPALVQLAIVRQGGAARGQIYYPFMSFRVSRTLQVRAPRTLPPTACQAGPVCTDPAVRPVAVQVNSVPHTTHCWAW